MNDLWGTPGAPLLTLVGLVVGTVYVLYLVVCWFWSGDFKFWWNYERHIRVQKPRNPRGWD